MFGHSMGARVYFGWSRLYGVSRRGRDRNVMHWRLAHVFWLYVLEHSRELHHPLRLFFPRVLFGVTKQASTTRV